MKLVPKMPESLIVTQHYMKRNKKSNFNAV